MLSYQRFLPSNMASWEGHVTCKLGFSTRGRHVVETNVLVYSCKEKYANSKHNAQFTNTLDYFGALCNTRPLPLKETNYVSRFFCGTTPCFGGFQNDVIPGKAPWVFVLKLTNVGIKCTVNIVVSNLYFMKVG